MNKIVVLIILIILIIILVSLLTLLVNTQSVDAESESSFLTCENSPHGCCSDQKTFKINSEGINCSSEVDCSNSKTNDQIIIPNTQHIPPTKNDMILPNCSQTKYGCCLDNNTEKTDPQGLNHYILEFLILFH